MPRNEALTYTLIPPTKDTKETDVILFSCSMCTHLVTADQFPRHNIVHSRANAMVTTTSLVFGRYEKLIARYTRPIVTPVISERN